MFTSYQLQISEQRNGKTKILKQILVVRLLAFINNPTPSTWSDLNNGNIARPFSHLCRRGLPQLGQHSSRCINGISHGFFESRNDNESCKACTNGARCLCPGHGSSRSKCIFTHPDGQLKPCLMNETHVPICKCSSSCFGNGCP